MAQGIASLDANTMEDQTMQAPRSEDRGDPSAALAQAFSSLSNKDISGLRDISSQLLEMSQEELVALRQVIDFINRKQDQYDIAVQTLIQQGVVEAGDLPPDYIPAFFEILSTLVDDAMSKASGPRPSEQGFAKGGIAQLAKAGRNGDTILAHLSPKSASTLKRVGGSGTINPKTGLKEYFLGNIFKGIGNFFKSAAGVILPVALSFAFPGLGTIATGAIGAGVGALINGAKPSEALGAALTGGIGGALFSGVTGMMGNKGFMGGITGALPTGFPGSTNTASYVPSFFGGSGSAAPSASAGYSGPKGVADGVAGLSEAAYRAGEAGRGAAAAAGPGILERAAGFVREYPLLTAGGAALAGTALGASLSESKEAPKMSMPEGATPEMIAAARFPAGAFISRAAPRVNLTPTYSPAYAATGGEIDARHGGHLMGPGTGTSDSIPARLSDGEFVMTARAVRGAGGGSREDGAKKMYDMMHKFEKRA